MQSNNQDPPSAANEDGSAQHRQVKLVIKKPVDTAKVTIDASKDYFNEKSSIAMEIQDKEPPSQQQNYENSPPLADKGLSSSTGSLRLCRKRALYKAVVDGEKNGHGSNADASNQLVLYNPNASNISPDITPVPNHNESYSMVIHKMMASNPASRVLPSVGAYTVQCASCFKWRFIPTKEKYEQIREHILESPFMCDQAREWRPDIKCEEPTDIMQDGSRLWAIDKPNIAQPPPGWVRELRIRGEGSSKFADVYYTAPSGKKLRSMVEVQRYLVENPMYAAEGVQLSQFSFQTPKPLQENYVRKRPAKVSNPTDGSLVPRPLEPEEANRLSWVEPTEEDRGQALGTTTPPFDSPQPSSRKKKKICRPDINTSDVRNNNQDL